MLVPFGMAMDRFEGIQPSWSDYGGFVVLVSGAVMILLTAGVGAWRGPDGRLRRSGHFRAVLVAAAGVNVAGILYAGSEFLAGGADGGFAAVAVAVGAVSAAGCLGACRVQPASPI